MAELLGLNLVWDGKDFAKLVSRLVLDLAFVWIVIRWIYLRLHHRREFAFSCVMLNVITFAICLLLRKVPVDLGFALGLFAVFGILRYRTEPISARDLTYLFVVLGLGIINSVANKKVSLAELLFINATVVGIAAWLEYAPFGARRRERIVLYDRLDLLPPERRPELLADLGARLGDNVVAVRIEDVDLLRDTARLVVSSAVDSTKPAPEHDSVPRAASLPPDASRAA